MNTVSIAQLSISVAASLLDAMRALEACGRDGLCVLDASGSMRGMLTDGDIRRGLLRGLSLDAPVREVMTREFCSVDAAVDRNYVLDLMQARSIKQVPILDADRRLVGVHFLRDLIGASDRQNQALIMAGGRGTRLRPLTDNLPKPLVKVAGRTILERLVLQLVGYGIKRIHVSINYLGHMIKEHLGDGSRFGCAITYLREETELGTGGALSLLPERPADPLLVLNGDLVIEADLAELLDYHVRRGNAATLAAKRYNHVIPYGLVDFEGGLLTGFREKPCLECFINAGIYVFDPDILDLVPAGVFFPITDLFERCLETGRPVSVYQLTQEWQDLGTHAQLRAARGESPA